ncbi:MAG: O-antigen ligase family protein, partial [Burkholderiales bacterium]|nr:O-antigen ligase family protein [Opitutaceae bacterium]
VFSAPLLLVALAAAALPLTDLAREPRWALTFAVTLTTTAFLVAVLAFAQNHTRAAGIFWNNDGRMPGAFTGTFFHHTSFGAYLNPAWPLAAALAWLARRRHPILAALAAIACFLLLASHTAHIGRFPQFTALLIAPLFLLGLKPRLPSFRSPRVWLLAAAALVALSLLVTVGGRTSSIGSRWRLLVHPVSIPLIQPVEAEWPALIRDDLVIVGTSHPGWFGDRVFGWRAALSAIAERPLTGHGPANWMGAASRHTDDPFVRTFYQFLQFTHQDPLQTAVEWGVPAALAFWTLLLGGLVSVVRLRIRPPLALAAACALAALLLQSQLDFPLQIPALVFHAVVLAALCHSAASHRPPVSSAA